MPLSKSVCRACLQQELTRVQDEIANLENAEQQPKWEFYIEDKKSWIMIFKHHIRKTEYRNRKFRRCPLKVFAKDKKYHCKFRLEQLMAAGAKS